MAIGLYFSMVPIIPQSIIAAILAMKVKANVPFAVMACWISNPFTNVPFWVAQVWLGQWLVDTFSIPIPFEKLHVDLYGVGEVSVSSWIVGFTAMGVLMALLAYPIVHLFSLILPHHLPVRSRRIKVAREARGT